MNENAFLYNTYGEIVLCKCGKPAGIAAIGKEVYMAWCNDCAPTSKEEAEFVYRPPKNPPIIPEEWIVNLREKE